MARRSASVLRPSQSAMVWGMPASRAASINHSLYSPKGQTMIRGRTPACCQMKLALCATAALMR